MARLQELNREQMSQAIAGATERKVPVTVTIRQEKGWANLRSRLLAVRDPHLLLAGPQMHEGETPPVISPAEKLGLSFKLKHHKHIFTVTAVSTETPDSGPERGQEVLVVCWPTRMHRLQRRAYLRIEVPPGKVVRASFWLGGMDSEPSQATPDRPVWSGRVTNLSAGGFQLVVDNDEVWGLDVGETVGIRLSFEAGSESIHVDGQFRHLEDNEGRWLMGFQFIGLAQDRESRQALQFISNKVAEYQHEQDDRGHRAKP